MVYIESASRLQKAVLWELGTTATSTGKAKVKAAAEISVRWVEAESQGLSEAGETIRLDSKAVVNQDIEVGSLMWLGSLSSLPSPVTDLYKVVSFSKVAGIKATRFRRSVGLQRYSDTLPPIET